MRIKVSGVMMVDDQDKALKFSTEVSGFVENTDLSVRNARSEKAHRS